MYFGVYSHLWKPPYGLNDQEAFSLFEAIWTRQGTGVWWNEETVDTH